MEHSWKNLCDPVWLWYGLIFAVFFSRPWIWTPPSMSNQVWFTSNSFPRDIINPLKSGWWYTNPSEKYEFVSWDDEIPNIWTVRKFHGSSRHQSEIYWNDPVTWSLTGLKGVDVTVFQQSPSAMVSPRIHWHRLMFLLRRLRQFWQILCWPVLPCFGSSKSQKPQPIAGCKSTGIPITLLVIEKNHFRRKKHIRPLKT